MLLDHTIQSSYYCPIEDAKATWRLYKLEEVAIDAKQDRGDRSTAPLSDSAKTEENADDTDLIDLSATLGWLSFEIVPTTKEALQASSTSAWAFTSSQIRTPHPKGLSRL